MQKRPFPHRCWAAFALAAVLASGCTGSSTDPEELPDPEQPVRFTTDVWSNARAATPTTAFANGDKIGVFAYYNTEATAPDFMNNQLVTCTATSPQAWEYTPVKYWPHYGNLSFYAYAPYQAGVSMSTQGTIACATTQTNGSFTLDGNTDLLIATTTASKQTVDAAVRLPFRHTLAKLSFSFALASEGSTITVHSISFNVPTGGTVCLTGENVSWDTTGSASTTVTFSPAIEVNSTTPTAAQEYDAFVIPCTISNWTLNVSVDGGTATDRTSDTSVTLTAGQTTPIQIQLTPSSVQPAG